ncbi:ABC transporter ATP-binding protein [Caldicellulosiruptor naganoensis]|uniref:ABC transporter ATP-binding protein n=1 Tax=Caldicellulosiruptor naganoensis TaxID=29324 RepID=A0ABY7BF49_9FIRM|nr:ABC transporter ATP-binding protein [Caldicellulosiruptor naganoensis]WAM31443.1 ABC transporter ATP-binding protein [Caldicellulosiruptor naganoensis]
MLLINNVYSGYADSIVLHGISLRVDKNSIVGIIGRNGVGKTTLLKTILGIVKIKMGEIWFEEKLINSLKPYERAELGIGYVPQGRGIFPQLTVAENLLIMDKNVKNRIEEVFTLFPKLKVLMKRKGGSLSGGEQQQLAIARALIKTPKLLILDEPTEGIQPSVVETIVSALYEIKKRGISVLIVEQNLDLLLEIGDYYYFLDSGHVVDEGVINEESYPTMCRLLMV